MLGGEAEPRQEFQVSAKICIGKMGMDGKMNWGVCVCVEKGLCVMRV